MKSLTFISNCQRQKFVYLVPFVLSEALCYRCREIDSFGFN